MMVLKNVSVSPASLPVHAVTAATLGSPRLPFRYHIFVFIVSAKITILSLSISSSALSAGSGRFVQSCRCQGDPRLFIRTLDRCGRSLIGLLLVVKKHLMGGLACSDQSGTDSCLLEAGCMWKAPPPYFSTRVKITQKTLAFYRIMYESMTFCAENAFQTARSTL